MNNDLVNVTAGSAILENESFINVLDISTDGYVIKAKDEFSIIRTTDGITDEGVLITGNSAVLVFTGAVIQNDYVLTASLESSFANVVKGLNSNSTMSAIDSEAFNATGDFATVIGQLQMLGTSELQEASKELSPISHTPASTVSSISTQKIAGGTANYLVSRRLGVQRAMMAELRNTDSGCSLQTRRTILIFLRQLLKEASETKKPGSKRPTTK